jgi:hypothetical protein
MGTRRIAADGVCDIPIWNVSKRSLKSSLAYWLVDPAS